MDAFYASVEQRDRPELRGRPVIVGGSPGGRGVVAAASYEARRYGIHSAMPAGQAARLCSHAVFVPVDMARYRAVSRQIFAIFREITPLVEGLSLDEAYLDVTENTLGERYARDVARILKARVREETGLTISCGVGPSKLVAKIASDMRKPDGLVVVAPEQVEAFLSPLPVRKLWGVGPATAKRLETLGLRTVADVRRVDPASLERVLGKHGPFLHRLASGDDPRQVTPHREPKSRGAERTFEEDVTSVELLERVIAEQAGSVARSLERLKRPGRTVVLKLRYADFTTITRSTTLPEPTDRADVIARTAAQLMADHTAAGERPVRLIGVSVSGLRSPDEPEQLELPLPLDAGDEDSENFFRVGS